MTVDGMWDGGREKINIGLGLVLELSREKRAGDIAPECLACR